MAITSQILYELIKDYHPSLTASHLRLLLSTSKKIADSFRDEKLANYFPEPGRYAPSVRDFFLKYILLDESYRKKAEQLKKDAEQRKGKKVTRCKIKDILFNDFCNTGNASEVFLAINKDYNQAGLCEIWDNISPKDWVFPTFHDRLKQILVEMCFHMEKDTNAEERRLNPEKKGEAKKYILNFLTEKGGISMDSAEYAFIASLPDSDFNAICTYLIKCAVDTSKKEHVHSNPEHTFTSSKEYTHYDISDDALETYRNIVAVAQELGEKFAIIDRIKTDPIKSEIVAGDIQIRINALRKLFYTAIEKEQTAYALINDSPDSTVHCSPSLPESNHSWKKDSISIDSDALSDLKAWLKVSSDETKFIEEGLSAVIFRYITTNSCSNEEFTTLLELLPVNEMTAETLIELTYYYDGIPELWEVIFEKYTNSISPAQLDHLVSRAKSIWDYEMYTLWGI